MATTLALLLELPFSCFCCYFAIHDDDETSSTLTPLLDRLDRSPPPSPAAAMPRKTYGTKRSAVSRAAALMFGGAEQRSPLADVTDAITNLSIQEKEEERDYDSANASIYDPADSSIIPTPTSLLPLCAAYKTDTKKSLWVEDWTDIIGDNDNLVKIAEASYAEVYRVTNSEGTSILKIMRVKMPEVPESLNILTAVDVTDLISEIRIMNALTEHPGFVTFKGAHLVQGQTPRCLITAWHEHQEGLKKYAEESAKRDVQGHAELPSEEDVEENGEDGDDEGGEQDGKPVVGGEVDEEAYHFLDPKTYQEEDIFLIIELGDAGDPLNDCELTTVEEFYDIFIGTTIALARAELTNGFEHRDLHENNICIKLKDDFVENDPNRPKNCISSLLRLKYGFSGLEITIIDYGLSRAELVNGEIMFKDLEQDLEVFKGVDDGIAGIQYDTYRRMRTHLIEGTRTHRPLKWHTPTTFTSSKLNRDWSSHIPYTNVLWLRYLLFFLINRLKESLPTAKEQKKLKPHSKKGRMTERFKELEEEIKELKRRLDPRTKNGAFGSALDVSDWMMGPGVSWVAAEQVMNEDGESFLK
ncbi:uncharacterized protein PAC_17082 [Phialocephala subalpina]|uniref:non-specific serine/threonine protein kinase n=1 Tax=Phialocephala subalpina TaxID=576137 RepID=A0A1L7XQ72_9HELO|nr:uncharacterized protein PAC_17082 [Phialocephala subalpina]